MKSPMHYLFVFRLLPLLAALMAVWPPVQGKGSEFSRKINREFVVSPTALIILENQFGSVVCETWEKPEVSVEVVISVEESSQERADKILNSIIIGISGNREQVMAKTTFAAGFNTRKPFHVDYLVRMPATVTLDISNKFGDITMDDRNGKTTLKLGHGHAAIGTLRHGENRLDVEFGSLKITHMKKGHITAGFSKLNLGNAGEVHLKSNYSEVSAEELVSMEGVMTGGRLTLAKAGSMTLNTTYTDVHVGFLMKKLVLNGKFGNVEIRQVDPGCTLISVTDEFGNYTIPLGAFSGFSIDAESKGGRIQLPGKKTTFTEFRESGPDMYYKGTVGESSSLQVKIRSRFGNIILK